MTLDSSKTDSYYYKKKKKLKMHKVQRLNTTTTITFQDEVFRTTSVTYRIELKH